MSVGRRGRTFHVLIVLGRESKINVRSSFFRWASEARISLNDFTHLRKLELRGFEHPKDVRLPWEQITSLRLDNSSVDLCISLLVRCPNLVEFHAMNCIKPKNIRGSLVTHTSSNIWRGDLMINYFDFLPFVHSIGIAHTHIVAGGQQRKKWAPCTP